MTVKPPHHGRDHRPGGEDPIPLQALVDGIGSLGGKMPWFESTYLITGAGHLTSGVVHTADQFGGFEPTVRTTDNPAGFTDVLTTPQVYTAGSYFSCDYSGAPEIAVNVLQAGVYHMTARFSVTHDDISAGSPFMASVGMQVTTLGPTVTQYASDSRYISDALLSDAGSGTPVEYQGEMVTGWIVAEKTFYVPSAATVQVFYLHEATLIGTGIEFAVYRISDGAGNSAPGSSGIGYDVVNSGDWLYVEATDQGGTYTSGIQLLSSGPGVIRVTTTDPGTDIQIESAAAFSTAAVDNITLDSSTGDIRFRAAGILAMKISGIDGSIHIPTGATIHADL